MILLSHSRKITDIEFPRYAGRQHYMATTTGAAVELPPHISDYNAGVKRLCDALGYRGVIHVTVDEKALRAGETQRKPGIHVDGRFNGVSWGHSPGWNHYCNELPMPRMAVAVASTVPRCKVYEGLFLGEPDIQGDLSHIADQVGSGRIIPPHEWHLLSPDCVHESLPMERSGRRAFIRVAFEDLGAPQ